MVICKLLMLLLSRGLHKCMEGRLGLGGVLQVAAVMGNF